MLRSDIIRILNRSHWNGTTCNLTRRYLYIKFNSKPKLYLFQFWLSPFSLVLLAVRRPIFSENPFATLTTLSNVEQTSVTLIGHSNSFGILPSILDLNKFKSCIHWFIQNKKTDKVFTDKKLTSFYIQNIVFVGFWHDWILTNGTLTRSLTWTQRMRTLETRARHDGRRKRSDPVSALTSSWSCALLAGSPEYGSTWTIWKLEYLYQQSLFFNSSLP